VRRALLLLACLLAPACKTSFGGYLSDRLEDTVDIVPFSVGFGPGFYVGARATAFAGTGIGWASTHRIGWRRRSPWPEEAAGTLTFLDWHEREKGLVLAWDRSSDPLPGAGNFLVVLPAYDPDGTLGYRAILDAGSVFDLELEVHVGLVGIRIGVSPMQAIDWLFGWTTFDLFGDDRYGRFEAKTVAAKKDKTGSAPVIEREPVREPEPP